jgi:hypothetical protein
LNKKATEYGRRWFRCGKCESCDSLEFTSQWAQKLNLVFLKPEQCNLDDTKWHGRDGFDGGPGIEGKGPILQTYLSGHSHALDYAKRALEDIAPRMRFFKKDGNSETAADGQPSMPVSRKARGSSPPSPPSSPRRKCELLALPPMIMSSDILLLRLTLAEQNPSAYFRNLRTHVRSQVFLKLLMPCDVRYLLRHLGDLLCTKVRKVSVSIY